MKRRTVLTVSVPLLAAFSLLAACGSDSSSSPAKIRIGASPNGGGAKLAATSEAAMADDRMARPGIYPMIRNVYELADGLTKPEGKYRAWRFPKTPEPVSQSRKDALLKAFGLTGTWKAQPADQGGGEAFVPTKGAATLFISPDAMQNWWYSPDWSEISTAVTGAVVCVEPGIAVSEPNEGSGSSDASGGAAPEPATSDTVVVDTRPVEPCPQPEPPKNVPTADEAKQRTLDLLDALGYDTDDFTVDSYGDQWSAYANAFLTLDGVRAQMAMYVSFGGEGVITGAGGFLAEPERADEYELVDLDVAVKRLNDQQSMWLGGYGGPMAKDAISSTVRSGGAGSEVAPDAVAGSAAGEVSGGTDGSVSTKPAEQPDDIVAPSLPPDSTLVDPVVDTVVVDTTIPVEEVVVTLTKVRVELSMVWDADGTVWLLPTYVFSTKDQGEYQMLALADEYVEFALPDVVPMPAVEPAVEPVDPSVPADEPTEEPSDRTESGSGTMPEGNTEN